MNKNMSFLLGLTAGVLVAANWRQLAKKGIRTGIVAGRKLKEISEQAMEDLEDVAAEAAEELADKEPAG